MFQNCPEPSLMRFFQNSTKKRTMYRSYLKSKVFENQNLFMWSSKESNGAENTTPSGSMFGDWAFSECKPFAAEGNGQSGLYLTKAIVIVEPRQIRKNATASSTASSTASYPTLPLSTSNSSTSPSSSSSSSSNSSPTSSLSLLPQSVDLNNDVMRMISSLSTVVQILTRMTNAAALELRHHPEREEGFQGLRMLLNYADQMYTTLLQPRQFQVERPTSPQSSASSSLFHHLFEPILVPQIRQEQEADVGVPSYRYLPSPPTSDRSHQQRALPYRVAAISASAGAGTVVALTGDADTELSASSTQSLSHAEGD